MFHQASEVSHTISLKNSLRPRFLDVGASRRIDDTGYLQDRTCIRELRYVVVALHGVYR